MKKKTKIIAGVLISAAVLAYPFKGLVIDPIYTEIRYNTALELIENGEWRDAYKILLNEIWSYKYIGCHDEGYRDQYELMKYIRMEQNFEDEDYLIALDYYEDIGEDYSGAFSASIADLAERAKPLAEIQRETEEAEKARKAEEYEKTVAERKEREQLTARRSAKPFVGMSEDCINITKLGRSAYFSEGKQFFDGQMVAYKLYRWKNSNGKIIFTANVMCGEVQSVTDLSASHYSGGASTTDKDEYNASDYSNIDDFYDDYYDDFPDFESAEGYWQEHN